ncbi:MAG: UPF0175 family protein [Coriobacteriia bacterium]|nr:UPF0175 family protein [Coriobacteriia bacterium]
MQPVAIEFPEEVLLATGQSRAEFVREAKLLLAARLFERGRLSSGKAAEMADMGHADFLFAVSRMGMDVADLDAEELRREFADA